MVHGVNNPWVLSWSNALSRTRVFLGFRGILTSGCVHCHPTPMWASLSITWRLSINVPSMLCQFGDGGFEWHLHMIAPEGGKNKIVRRPWSLAIGRHMHHWLPLKKNNLIQFRLSNRPNTQTERNGKRNEKKRKEKPHFQVNLFKKPFDLATRREPGFVSLRHCERLLCGRAFGRSRLSIAI